RAHFRLGNFQGGTMALGRALVFFLAASTLFAQEYRATLTGSVTDTSGGSIANAAVKAVNRATNVSATSRTGTDGLYSLPLLDPGVYDIEVTASGFQAVKRQGIILEVSQRLNLPVQMGVGQMSQQVTVTGGQEIIDTN